MVVASDTSLLAALLLMAAAKQPAQTAPNKKIHRAFDFICSCVIFRFDYPIECCSISSNTACRQMFQGLSRIRPRSKDFCTNKSLASDHARDVPLAVFRLDRG